MASYAAVASKPAVTSSFQNENTQDDITEWIEVLAQVTTPPENLAHLVEILRREMEIPSGFRSGQRNFGPTEGTGQSWRSGLSGASRGRFSPPTSPFDSRYRQSAPLEDKAPRVTPGRYQSRFKATGNIEDKILNTVIGNKLNSFTPLTYNDTRDFIYQIMDSGETEFTRDFIEKVFSKATVEDLYCALFAKLIAEIAHRYPVMYEEMNKYHKEFLKIFDDVQEDSNVEYELLVKQKQYRMGYGQFIAELAGLNALEKGQLVAMVKTVFDKIWVFSAEENRTKSVEEFIDCLVRLTTGLRERSRVFFNSVKDEVNGMLLERLVALISRKDERPSLSNKGRFGLMDLKDILSS